MPFPIASFDDYASYALACLLGVIAGLVARFIRSLNRPAWVVQKSSHWRYVCAGGLAGIVTRFLAGHFGWSAPDWNWPLVAALGGVVAVSELASRYRDEPTKAIFSLPAGIYVLLNACTAMLALVIGRSTMGWTVSDAAEIDWPHVLAAGLGAMVILRSSVFKVRIGDRDVDVGPSTFLQSILEAADRAVDRTRARERAWTVARIMEGVASEKALAILPSYLRALMQNSSDDDRKKFEAAIDDIGKRNAGGDVQALMLGLAAMNYSGEGVLSAAVASVAAQIHASAAVAEKAADGAMQAAEATRQATGAVLTQLQAGLAASLPDADMAAGPAKTAASTATGPAAKAAALAVAKVANAAAGNTVAQAAETSAATQEAAAIAGALSEAVAHAPVAAARAPRSRPGLLAWFTRRPAQKGLR